MNAKTCLLALALAAIPAAASAQSVSTSCYSHKRSVRCYSTYNPGLGESIERLVRAYRGRQHDFTTDPMAIQQYDYLMEKDRFKKQAEAIRQRDPRNQSEDYQRWWIGEAIRTNNCPEAHRYAASTGNPAMIKRAEEFCGKPLASGPETRQTAQTGPAAHLEEGTTK
jgi:hypothetical protein